MPEPRFDKVAAAKAYFIKKILWHRKTCNFIKKETLAQMFSCDFCEIWQNTFFTEHLWTTASENGEYQKIRIDVLKQVLKRQLIIEEISLSEFV